MMQRHFFGGTSRHNEQKTERRDAAHLLDLVRQDRFPQIWVPSLEARDVRQLLVHRHKQVQARTRTKNQLQAMALTGHAVVRDRMTGLFEARVALEKLPPAGEGQFKQ